MLFANVWAMLCVPWSANRGAVRGKKTVTVVLFFIANLASSAALMEASSRVTVQVLLLALVVQVTLSQHWSYGWLPGGKRSVGELEATIRVSDLFALLQCGIFMKFKGALCNFGDLCYLQ